MIQNSRISVLKIALGLVLVVGSTLLPTGCKSEPLDAPPSAPPGPTYTGPAYLRGTVGSLTRIKNNQSIPVSGYGLIVRLNGTGSSEAPAGLRNFMVQQMKKGGFGSARLGTTALTPRRVIADKDTAIVAVQGLIPPGATPGTRFDVLVSALPGTQTTSLAGGDMFPADLSINGLQTASTYSTPLARANGPTYLNPFDDEAPEEQSQKFRRQAVIVDGGKVTKARRIALVLNQPSYSRSRAISDRINERFGMGPNDRRRRTADPKSDSRIMLHIPNRYAARPQQLLSLIDHLFIQRSPQFKPRQARRLYRQLKAQPENREDIIKAWKALGKTIIPVLRHYYDDPAMRLRLAALEAGAYHGDGEAGEQLIRLAQNQDPSVREQAAKALTYLPRKLEATRTLKHLLSDERTAVRLAAYESLSENNDPIIDRMPLRDSGGLKFAIDRVPAKRPLVYITQKDFPRLVLFGTKLGFVPHLAARLWDGRLMLRKPRTMPQALAGVEPGKSAFVPVYGRANIRELGAKWATKIRDGQGNNAALSIESKSLRDRFEKAVKPSGDQLQTIAIVRLVEKHRDPQAVGEQYKLRLIGLRSSDQPRPVTVYYQAPGKIQGKTYTIDPDVATFAYMLGHEPSERQPQEGLDLSYSQVVSAIYHLCKQKAIPAPVKIAPSPLAQIAQRYDQIKQSTPNRRPETSTPAPPKQPQTEPKNY